MPNINLSAMVTENRNNASENIDCASTIEILQIINNEDKQVALAVEKQLTYIANAVDAISNAFLNHGRLIYLGAGTSGRLGILDASECPPTYGTPPEQVIGLIAGGKPAIFKAVENAEDSPELAINDLKHINFSAKDILVGIAASGRTPYVIGGMQYAKSLGATVVSLCCNPNAPMINLANIAITPIVGAEVITGSSRMKAGTAQKMILNMLTTASMIKIGKVYGNLMVDVEATNAKLVERQISIVMQATDCNRDTAITTLNQCNQHCKTAILMILAGLTAQQAKTKLEQNNGFIRKALVQNNT
ncbi:MULTISPECIES: N-acetylmuramic acid 6-phosphate etherase [unclassified Gilliamella]|uniref:N-acetylmuramic acid 6-phosphate etherase n=1 Tax=unclassified Gilliamella TaxID=2685620 RepID=UPI001DB2546E|nr:MULTISPECIES: N-acetylmuramic acid 6-phosphate etherase [unclassified Gilliamella]MBI0038331.1 N-acetylmuramic acid 6-phosphate etherase [Gilliamella sp. B14384G10]MBI0040372.1 N-acetylmuramic acid 6-phosphate etherase [Gilliamella sp. B14384G7]MBI0052211.1 N-acetylmuramic acid 6-phosphate etherase [Gilliamella sp. B14384G13]MBI0054618.1 N-acetylmuramic acid 6-phosphate etherase [Gilliamella sp. B14384H2]